MAAGAMLTLICSLYLLMLHMLCLSTPVASL